MSGRLNTQLIEIIRACVKNIDLFSHVFLFGSALKNENMANDIDILIIYEIGKIDAVGEEVRRFSKTLENICKKSVHLTVLSSSEEQEVGFLSRIDANSYMIK